MKIGILIDSTFYVGEEFIKENNLKVIPLSVNFENKSYIERAESKKELEEIYETIKKHKTPATNNFVFIDNL